MKIALCLHGVFNSTTDNSSLGIDGHNYIKKHILSTNDVDVYIHSWDVEKQEEIKKLYNPIEFAFEQQVDFAHIAASRGINKLQGCPRPPHNVLSHFYSIQKCFNLLYSSNKKYDMVIKSRFDLGRINRNTSGPGRHNPYPVQCINLLQSIEADKLYMANWNHFHMGPADMWFYGDYNTMKPFQTIYDRLDDQFFINSPFHKFAVDIEKNVGDLSNSIAFYKWWMMENELWNKRVTLDTVWE